jgi:serine phosphatase RsbU (regulator of sigma subunit)
MIVERWSRLPIRRQLTLAVNSLLVIVVSAFLLAGHGMRVRDAEREKRIALAEEAKTVYESADTIANRGIDSIQKLIDDVCARMNTEDSPGHHIAVDWQGSAMQAKSHGRASHDLFRAMRVEAGSAEKSSSASLPIVVGTFEGPHGTIYVSESKTSVLTSARQELLRQVTAVLIAGAMAALMVNLVLRKVVTKPLRRLVTSLKSIGDGELNVRAQEGSCEELSFLTEHINNMSAKLAKADQDRRIHMKKAREIQQHLRPISRQLGAVSTAELFEPAEDVGGDYFDAISLSDNRCLLCLADVSGHGVPAAMAATVIKALVLESLEITQSPAEILRRINRRYTEIIIPGHFATMVVVVIDNETKILTCGNAGHEHPFILLPGKLVKRFTSSDLVLGVDENTVYHEETMPFETGTKIVLVSDGITEMFDPEENQFGTQRVRQVMQESNGATVHELVGHFAEALSRFRESRPPFDDTTLLAAEVN